MHTPFVTPARHAPLVSPAADDITRIRPPDSGQLFARRAARFRALAADHALAEWLVFLAALSDAQQHAANQITDQAPFPVLALEHARAHALPPLSGRYRPDRKSWHPTFVLLADALTPQVSAPARAALDQLKTAPDRFDALALALLNGHAIPEEESNALPAAALLPFVAAALQAIWTIRASRLDTTQLGDSAAPELCPCCGSPPVASTVRLDDTVNNLRYLHCALCNTAWYRPRATCTACGDEAQVAYRQIEGSNGAVRAESCDACMSYLKITYQDKDVQVDPVADDLATLALDLLMDEAGYSRSGPNYLLAGAGG